MVLFFNSLILQGYVGSQFMDFSGIGVCSLSSQFVFSEAVRVESSIP